jgi:hypothetical protein
VPRGVAGIVGVEIPTGVGHAQFVRPREQRGPGRDGAAAEDVGRERGVAGALLQLAGRGEDGVLADKQFPKGDLLGVGPRLDALKEGQFDDLFFQHQVVMSPVERRTSYQGEPVEY